MGVPGPRCKAIVETCDRLFSDRMPLMSLWQEMADNFYVEHADFTAGRSMGDDFASHLTTSAPIIARRTLGNVFSTMLRPRNKDWFLATTNNEESLGLEDKRFLERITKIQKNAINDRKCGFTRMTVQADHGIVTFGQYPMQIEWDWGNSRLLCRAWHLRNVAWTEYPNRDIAMIVRRWEPTALNLKRLMKDKVSPKVDEMIAQQKGNEKVLCYHIICPADEYDDTGRANGKPYYSINYDKTNEWLMTDSAVMSQQYVIPRWWLINGSQYAYSPSTTAALPDGRLIQSQMFTLLDAGQKAVHPSMIAKSEMVRSIDLVPAGISWIDADFDGNVGDALQPIPMDKSGLMFGKDMFEATRQALDQAFFLNDIGLPQLDAKMTAYETGVRVAEYVRRALPLFEPLETEYNGAMSDMIFTTLRDAGQFGSYRDFPDNLREADVVFRFENPLTEAAEAAKAQIYIGGQAIIAQGLDADPSVGAIINYKKATREALLAAGFPADWVNTEEEVEALVAGQKQAAETQSTLAGLQQGADIAATLGKASKDLAPMTQAAL